MGKCEKDQNQEKNGTIGRKAAKDGPKREEKIANKDRAKKREKH